MDWPDPKAFVSFENYEEAWHKRFQELNPNWREMGMYTSGQFDDMPYENWYGYNEEE